mgnify:CR=1 FL=1
MIKGGCLCGAVRYCADGEPVFQAFCHCRDCQRASGGGHLPVAGAMRETFSTTGETRTFQTKSAKGHDATRHFCPACGSLLFGESSGAPGLVMIYMGTADEPSAFRPQMRIFTRDRPGWDAAEPNIPAFETFPPD